MRARARGNTLSNTCAAAAGQRVVQHSRSGERDAGRGPPALEVLDFSLAAVLAAQGVLPRPRPPPSAPMRSPGMLVAPSIVRHPDFQGDVETRLPYVCSTRELAKRYSQFVINEECQCIIGLAVRPPIRFSL
jgi:hypothetical protein